MSEVVSTYLKLKDNLGFISGSQGLRIFSDTLTFTTLVSSGSITPKITISAVGGKQPSGLKSASASAQLQRTDTHKVVIALSTRAPTDALSAKLIARKSTTNNIYIVNNRTPDSADVDTESAAENVIYELDRLRNIENRNDLVELLGVQ